MNNYFGKQCDFLDVFCTVVCVVKIKSHIEMQLPSYILEPFRLRRANHDNSYYDFVTKQKEMSWQTLSERIEASAQSATSQEISNVRCLVCGLREWSLSFVLTVPTYIFFNFHLVRDKNDIEFSLPRQKS